MGGNREHAEFTGQQGSNRESVRMNWVIIPDQINKGQGKSILGKHKEGKHVLNS